METNNIQPHPKYTLSEKLTPGQKLEQLYAVEYNWLQSADEKLYDAVIGALEKMANCGACPINPPIMGALLELGILEKRRTASELLDIFEALS